VTAVRIPTGQTITAWLSPAEKLCLGDILTLVDKLIEDETAPVDALQRGFQHYASYLVHADLMEAEFAGIMMQLFKEREDEDIRSAMFRINCQLSRILAALPLCDTRCCCRCAAFPEPMKCNVWMVNSLPAEPDPDCEDN
jgi:hypothetical protein